MCCSRNHIPYSVRTWWEYARSNSVLLQARQNKGLIWFTSVVCIECHVLACQVWCEHFQAYLVRRWARVQGQALAVGIDVKWWVESKNASWPALKFANLYTLPRPSKEVRLPFSREYIHGQYGKFSHQISIWAPKLYVQWLGLRVLSAKYCFWQSILDVVRPHWFSLPPPTCGNLYLLLKLQGDRMSIQVPS